MSCLPVSSRLLASCLCSAWLLAASSLQAEIKPFTFVQISDSHIGAENAAENLSKTLQDIENKVPEADFIVHTGDVSDMGYPEQYENYLNIIKTYPKKIYCAPGNHDVRWSESGKENFRNYLGPTYTSFEHNGVKFILLDSSMLIEHYGHLAGDQMDKLKSELGALTPDQPAILGMHHPPLSAGHFIDNEYEFAEVIRKHNVPLVCTGHGHAFERYAYNNTTYAMGGSTSPGDRAYRIYHVTPQRIEMVTRDMKKDKMTTESSIALQRPKDVIGELMGLKASGAKLPETKLRYKVSADPGVTFKNASYTLDKYKEGPPSAVADGEFEIDARAINPGVHQLVATVVDDQHATHVRMLYFRTGDQPQSAEEAKAQAAGSDTLTSSARIVREFPLKSGCQSHPVVDGDMLFVGSNDNIVRAIDLNAGRVLWEKDLKSEILSSPAVTTQSVIVGSCDKNVYCLNKKTGDVVWQCETSGPVLASPLIHEGTVYIGSGDKHMYAIDASTGAQKWHFQVEKLIKATPAIDKGRLFFGAWDNRFYCLNADTGELIWKVPVSTAELFSAATCNPVAVDGKVIFASHDYSIRCLDQKTGSHIWLYKPQANKNINKAEQGPSYSSPVIKGNVFYMGSIKGRVVGHRIDTGEKVFDLDVRPEKEDLLFDSIPTIEGDKLYVGSVGGNLYCVDLPSKSVEWSVALQPGYIFTRPVVWRGHILAGTLSNKVFEIAPVMRKASGVRQAKPGEQVRVLSEETSPTASQILIEPVDKSTPIKRTARRARSSRR